MQEEPPATKILRRILLAEDNPNDVQLTLIALAEYGIVNQVIVVHDGEQALDYLYQRGAYQMRDGGNPAVLLMDLKMPKVDGIEVLRTIRADKNLRTIPTVILSSSREERDLAASYKLGVNAYVVKPVEFSKFVEAVQRVGTFWALVNEPPPGTDRTSQA